MLNSIFSLPADKREAARIEKAREYEEKRKEKIFNPRNRLIGIDRNALEKQISEKKAREEEEQARNEAFRLKLLNDSKIAAQLEREIQDAKRKLNEDINRYRALHQRKEDRREYDLNDPDYLKKGLPARGLDDDPRLSISGAQKFEGEDMDLKRRHQYQAEQQRIWLEQQIDEQMRLEEEQKHAEIAYNEAIVARDRRTTQLALLESECRKLVEESTAKFNKALAAERATERRMKEIRDVEDKQRDIYNAITSDFLTENPDVANSCLGPSRIIGSRYKGMHPNIKESINKELLKQIVDNKDKQKQEKKYDNDWAQMINNFAYKASVSDSEMIEKRRAINRQILEENKLLCEEQKHIKDLVDNQRKITSVASEEFFNQFNKTTR